MSDVRVILHNVRSAHNVGSIFRTADGAGVSHIYLVGYTPRPVDRFGRVQPEIKKTSLGATESVGWEAFDDIADVIERLPANTTLVAVEQHASATPLRTFAPPLSVTYIFGNEIDGVTDEIINRADVVVELPMRGQKESLNVSVAVGIILYYGIY